VENRRRTEGRRRRKPGIVARQLEANNGSPFLAERLYCERQLTAGYAHAFAMPRRSATPRARHNESDTAGARIIRCCLLTCVSPARGTGSCPSRRFPPPSPPEERLTIRLLSGLSLAIIARRACVAARRKSSGGPAEKLCRGGGRRRRHSTRLTSLNASLARVVRQIPPELRFSNIPASAAIFDSRGFNPPPPPLCGPARFYAGPIVASPSEIALLIRAAGSLLSGIHVRVPKHVQYRSSLRPPPGHPAGVSRRGTRTAFENWSKLEMGYPVSSLICKLQEIREIGLTRQRQHPPFSSLAAPARVYPLPLQPRRLFPPPRFPHPPRARSFAAVIIRSMRAFSL